MSSHMPQAPGVGENRTGVSSSVDRAKDMQRGMDEFPPSSRGTRFGSDKIRVTYAKEGAAQGVGSIPGSKKPPLLVDKLGERLAFERMGVRLYEGLISKHESHGSFDGGPSREDLIEILNQEHHHFEMLTQIIGRLGGDPTVMTPSADVVATLGSGVSKVISDPRTTLMQSLEAILVAELADNDSWEALRDLADLSGEKDLAKECKTAIKVEKEHLKKVRGWLKAGMSQGNGHSRA